MPRPRKAQSSASQLTSGQAAYVLERLLGERRVTQTDVNRYVAEMGREISDLEARLKRLREAHGGAIAATVAGVATAAGAAVVVRRARGRRGRKGRAAAQSAGQTTAAAKGGRSRKRSTITSEQLASRQLQGRYLALVRRFSENKRAQYAKIAKDRGREAAIKEMQDALNKK